MTTRDYLQLARWTLILIFLFGGIVLADTLLLWAGWDGRVGL